METTIKALENKRDFYITALIKSLSAEQEKLWINYLQADADLIDAYEEEI